MVHRFSSVPFALCALSVSLVSVHTGLHTTAKAESAKPAPPFDAGNRSQVFIDQVLVDSAKGVTFTLHPATKHPAGPWLDHQKEKQGPAGPMVLYDEEEKLFKSWSPASYNTSKDGIYWGEKMGNPNSWDAIRRVSVIKDTKDPNPARRYKLLAFAPSGKVADENKGTRLASLPEEKLWYMMGYNTYISPDGKEVSHLSQEPILKGHDMISGYYDKRLGLFVAFPKTAGTGEEPRKYTARRCFSVLTSKDFETWSKPKLVFVPDEIDDASAMARIEEVRPLLLLPTNPKGVSTHIYGIGGPIQTECCAIALLRVFTTHNKGDAVSEIQFAVSRNAEHWERPFRKPFIPRGKVGANYESSDWDSGWFNNEGPALTVGDEVWVYYSARNTPHDHPVGFATSQFQPEVRAEARKQVGKKYFSGIGLATWKRDRFVSVDASPQGGMLTTVPLLFTGSRLELNAATKLGGEIVVEILDKARKVLARSKPLSGDDLRHGLEWHVPPDLAQLAVQRTPVSLRFLMKSAELYAFAFRD